jgi:sugar O-acyltransferase (sialic acid O-acetyltransferase NeuD family)
MSNQPISSLIIVGAGGAGKEAAWIAQRSGRWHVVGFFDDGKPVGEEIVPGSKVIGSTADLLAKKGDRASVHVAIGRNDVRRRIAESLLNAGYSLATVVDPTAVIAETASLGDGAYVAQFAIVGPSVKIGRGAILNVNCNVGHDAVVGDFCQICPGARVTGGATLGPGAFIGSNAVVLPGGSVGDWATLAAGSLAANEIPASATAIGVPAIVLGQSNERAGMTTAGPKLGESKGISPAPPASTTGHGITKLDFYRRLDELLEFSPGTIKGTERLSDLGKWDSLAIMGFIALLDQCFGRQVAADRILACTTVADLVQLAGLDAP